MSALKAAFFLKNISGWQRVLRLLLGAVGVAVGVGFGGPAGLVGAASALFLALTGVIGFCPMCALVGRRLPSKG